MFKVPKTRMGVPMNFRAGYTTCAIDPGRDDAPRCEACGHVITTTLVTAYFRSLMSSIYGSNLRDESTPYLVTCRLINWVTAIGDNPSFDLYKVRICCDCAKRMEVPLHKRQSDIVNILKNWCGTPVIMDD